MISSLHYFSSLKKYINHVISSLYYFSLIKKSISTTWYLHYITSRSLKKYINHVISSLHYLSLIKKRISTTWYLHYITSHSLKKYINHVISSLHYFSLIKKVYQPRDIFTTLLLIIKKSISTTWYLHYITSHSLKKYINHVISSLYYFSLIKKVYQPRDIFTTLLLTH